MVRVLALVEGQTEQGFLEQCIQPVLAAQGIVLSARLIGKPGRKGGIRKWSVARREIVSLLKSDPASFLTTMFDLYGLRPDWPGRAGSLNDRSRPDPAEVVEKAIRKDISTEFEPGLNRFIPYIQQYEFEALLFADPGELARVTENSDNETRFAQIVDECGGCEKINDNPNTAPSKRILDFSPNYQKRSSGLIAAQGIEISKMRSCCPHFDQWLRRLESLAAHTAK